MTESGIEELFEQAIALRNDGKLWEARDLLQKILVVYPADPKLSGVFSVLGGVHNSLDDHENAGQYFRKASELNPKSELASLGLYVSLLNMEEYDNAIKELKRYLDIYPAKMYRDTLEELLGDLANGFAVKWKDTILLLAAKNGIGPLS